MRKQTLAILFIIICARSYAVDTEHVNSYSSLPSASLSSTSLDQKTKQYGNFPNYFVRTWTDSFWGMNSYENEFDSVFNKYVDNISTSTDISAFSSQSYLTLMTLTYEIARAILEDQAKSPSKYTTQREKIWGNMYFQKTKSQFSSNEKSNFCKGIVENIYVDMEPSAFHTPNIQMCLDSFDELQSEYPDTITGLRGLLSGVFTTTFIKSFYL